jgi:hypothetical protein
MKEIKPHSAHTLTIKKGLTYKKGQWRNALMRAGEWIEKYGIDGEPPKGIIDQLAWRFLQNCLAASNKVEWFKELADRLDGKAEQAVSIGDPDGNPITYQIIRFADLPSNLPLVGTQDDASPKRLDS